MKEHFFFVFALFLWLLMAIGFSDNWLFDRAQESNSQPKFLIHAFFAFWWFTQLVVQSGLVRAGNIKLHMRLGVLGIFAYICMTATIWYMYFGNYLESSDVSRLIKPLEILSVVLVVAGFASRKRNVKRHREFLMFGSFCLVGPALDRTVFHLFGPENMLYPMLILYFILFGYFAAAIKKITWYMTLWVVFLAYSLFPLFERHFQAAGAM